MSGVKLGAAKAAKHLLAHPDLADRFDFISALGEGSVACVYLARDKARGGALVALKLLVHNDVFAGETAARFADEVTVSAEIVHPNIVTAYDVIAVGDTLALTMEYVEGVDLAARLASGTLSVAETEDVFLQVCAALEVLHAHGICHRDLKLENIFLRSDGVVKLGDFGLMVRGRLSAGARRPFLLGTPAYMPPEYVEGGLYDSRGDIWAAGLVLYELATGRRRLSGKRGSDALAYLVKTDYQIPTLTLTGLPKKFVRIIERALAVDPRARFQTAAELRAAMLVPHAEVPREGNIEVNSRLNLNEFTATMRRKRRWRDDVTPRGVALGLGIFFVALTATLGVCGRGEGGGFCEMERPEPPAGVGAPPSTQRPVSAVSGPKPVSVLKRGVEKGGARVGTEAPTSPRRRVAEPAQTAQARKNERVEADKAPRSRGSATTVK